MPMQALMAPNVGRIVGRSVTGQIDGGKKKPRESNGSFIKKDRLRPFDRGRAIDRLRASLIANEDLIVRALEDH
jgi:hypothetical protein